MAATKTTTLTFRSDPATKEGLRMATEKEYRGPDITEVMIRDYYRRNGITIQEQQVLSPENDRKP